MKPLPINPQEIKAGVTGKTGKAQPKAAFSDVMDGVLAMGPAAAELTAQWTGGSQLAGAVLNAAFSGIGTTSGGMGYSAYGSYADTPGVFGSPRYTTQTGVTGSGITGMTGVGATVDDPALYQREIMTTMNANNLKLLELQGLMQSSMQSWTTKSNILSADHRARMSIIEKFTARG